jgi:hypothetical protein
MQREWKAHDYPDHILFALAVNEAPDLAIIHYLYTSSLLRFLPLHHQICKHKYRARPSPFISAIVTPV